MREPLASSTGEAPPLLTPMKLVLLLLLLSLSVPAVWTWLQVIVGRTIEQNAIQFMTIVLLAAALWRSDFRPKPRYHPSMLGLVIMLLFGCFYLLGMMLSIRALAWGSFILMGAGLFWALCGFRCLYGWLPVFLFSFFLLPALPSDIQNAISLPLQMLSTQITTLLAGLIIPITASGNIFYINGEAYEVTVACSGLHTWLGFLFAGLLWLLFEPFSLRSLGLVLLGSPLLALLTNSVRLFMTALTAYYISPDSGIAVHTNLEFILFPLGLILMWVVMHRLSPDRQERSL